MRVGLTLYGSIDERSGGFRYDRKLVEGLRTAGDTVELVELPWRTYRRGLLDNASRRLRDRLRIDVDVWAHALLEYCISPPGKLFVIQFLYVHNSVTRLSVESGPV